MKNQLIHKQDWVLSQYNRFTDKRREHQVVVMWKYKAVCWCFMARNEFIHAAIHYSVLDYGKQPDMQSRMNEQLKTLKLEWLWSGLFTASHIVFVLEIRLGCWKNTSKYKDVAKWY